MQRLLAFLIGVVSLAAQAPPDSAAYSVAYVEIAPASRTAAITAIKQYRDASRKESGFRRLEFFEQAARPGHFCIIETWASGGDLDAHAASAHAKDYRAKIDAVRLSDYDQRPYKTLSLGPAPSDKSSHGSFVITHVDIGGQGTNAADLLRQAANTGGRRPARRRRQSPVRCPAAHDAGESFHGYRGMADAESPRDARRRCSHEGIPDQPRADRLQSAGRDDFTKSWSELALS